MKATIDSTNWKGGTRILTPEYALNLMRLTFTKAEYQRQAEEVAKCFPRTSIFTGEIAHPGELVDEYNDTVSALSLLRIAIGVSASKPEDRLAYLEKFGNIAKNGELFRGDTEFHHTQDQTGRRCTFLARVNESYARWLARAMPNSTTFPWGASVTATGFGGRLKGEVTLRETGRGKPHKFGVFWEECEYTLKATIEAECDMADAEWADAAPSFLAQLIARAHLGNVSIALDNNWKLFAYLPDPLSSLWFSSFNDEQARVTSVCQTCGNPLIGGRSDRKRCDKCAVWERQQRRKQGKSTRKLY